MALRFLARDDVLAAQLKLSTAPKTNIFAATKPNPLCAARQASTRACTFERVTNEVDNNVSVIDTATNMVVAAVSGGDNPRGVAVTPDGKQTCHPADAGDAGRPWLEDAQRVGTPFPPRDLGLS
jgi:YVTN family beta-propeller protein